MGILFNVWRKILTVSVLFSASSRILVIFEEKHWPFTNTSRLGTTPCKTNIKRKIIQLYYLKLIIKCIRFHLLVLPLQWFLFEICLKSAEQTFLYFLLWKNNAYSNNKVTTSFYTFHFFSLLLLLKYILLYDYLIFSDMNYTL